MPLVLRPMRESDAGAYERIVTSAFMGPGLMSLFYPSGVTPEILAHGRKQVIKILRNKPHVRIMVVLDTDLEPEAGDYVDPDNLDSVEGRVTLENTRQEGRIIGVGNWKIYEKERTDEDIKAEAAMDAEGGYAPGSKVEVLESFHAAIDKARKEELGNRPFVLLHILATDPKHHRRGVGAMQLAWGLAEADRLNLPSFLEASRMGKPLYARWGYQELRELPLDTRQYGSKENLVHYLMLRPPQKQTNGA